MGPRSALTLVIIGATLITGCAAQRQEEARAAIGKAVKECRAPYPPKTHYLDRSSCEAPIRRWAMQKTGSPPDMVKLYIAKRAMIAAKIDAGQITREQANVEMAASAVEIGQTISDRNNSQALAAAAILSVMPRAQPYQASQPYMIPNRSRLLPTVCEWV